MASEVKEFRVNNNGELVYKGFYPANNVRVSRTSLNGVNGDDSDTYEYVNSFGQLIAKENRVSSSDRRITYYVYDDFGRQRYVVPPIAEGAITVAGAYAPTHASFRTPVMAQIRLSQILFTASLLLTVDEFYRFTGIRSEHVKPFITG